MIAPPPVLVVDGLAIARLVGDRWVAPTPIPAVRYSILGIARTQPPLLLKPLVREEVPAGIFMLDAPPGVLYSGAARAPRRATELDPKGSLYRSALSDYLVSRKLKGARARLTRVVRCDLDGDGRDEVILEGSSRSGLAQTGLGGDGVRADDYSVVLVRTLVGGRVRTVPLWSALGRTAYSDAKLAAVADLDGDGRMEVVISWTAWEAGGAELWSFRAGRTKKLAARAAGV